MPSAVTRPNHRLRGKVAATIRAHGLIERGQKILVAVSGGPDSVALLSLLHSLAGPWRLSLTVIHCNYGLRGDESDEDALFVRTLCERFQVPCITRTVGVHRAPGESSSLQARARDARYRLFRELAAEVGADRVALGHTADDQAETVLLWMLRGAGLRGLGGMPRVRSALFVRPLLGVTRREILDYLNSRRLTYRTDSSNLKGLYLRNRIRRDLVPAFQQLVPAAARILARQADILREEDRLLQQLAEDRLPSLIQRSAPGRLSLGRAALLAQPIALQRRMLRLAIDRLLPDTAGPPFVIVDAILTYLASPRSGGVWRWRAVSLRCEQKCLRLSLEGVLHRPVGHHLARSTSGGESSPPALTVHAFPWTGIWPPTGDRLQIRTLSRRQGLALLHRPTRESALVDLDRIRRPLVVRSWQAGDWFCPAGMKGRRKKLQDYFTDAKLSRSERERIPLVVSPDGILWVAGWRTDERFRATAATVQFVQLTLVAKTESEGA